MVSDVTSTSTSICFVPAPGQTVVTSTKSFAVFAIASRPDQQIQVAVSDGSSSCFTLVQIPTIGDGYYTYTASVDVQHRPLSLKYSYDFDGDEIALDGHATVLPRAAEGAEKEFTTVIELEQQDDLVSVKIPWINPDDWQGWVWIRPRATWIEPRWMHLRDLPDLFSAHMLLLQPVNPAIDPSASFCIFPCSSSHAIVHVSGARDGEEPGVYARVRRINAGQAAAKVYVVGKITANEDVYASVDAAVGLAKTHLGMAAVPFVDPPAQDRGTLSPFNQLGFCTWSSIGENVRPTRAKLEKLVQSLKSAQIPVSSFIIDDGWQDIRSGMNGIAATRGLWSFDVWDGMDASFKETVSIIKEGLPTVENVGVWMTLHGYWNSIASQSPLVAKYKMRPFKLNAEFLPGIASDGFDDIQTLWLPDERDRVWWLPPKELTYQFWKDYFSVCADAGVTFAKGAEEAAALWDGMNKAADEVFGQGRVIHCMAHYERTVNGDIGMGVATNGMKVVFRNTDDFGLPRPNVHRDHIHYNLMNCIITSRMCLIPDADMFMSGAQWAEYHAVLRAFFPGPVLLSDRAEEHDLSVIRKLISTTTTGQFEIVKSQNPAEPVRSRVWEPSLDSGIGPSIKASSYFPGAKSSALIMWSSRDGAVQPSTDVILSSDVVDVLGLHILPDTKYALWFAEMEQVVRFDGGIGSGSVVPLAAVNLAPGTHEIITVAPFHNLGGTEFACLGLVDKYAGLAAVAGIETLETGLRTSVLFAGKLGFIVRPGSVGAGAVKVYVNSGPVAFSMTDLDQSGVLIKVDLTTENAPTSEKAVCWTVDVVVA
ncbi:glycoside hydrolase superfamily [Lipomyces tetrasporus]|uniref:Glycoside hydrolase superfamily n=1 Tax=Lipomyces tetrasporus TaxID=54092 RepID=A0AAD7R0L6_9ASCO|nr:glycoside hydrolase superfamily [Lipomyces tetrasporus]KAJ8103412.1 glycoside hydrolase superfamily [Lipomyces tetrasporus]